MTRVLFLDTEGYSETPIKHGVARYAESAEVMIASYAWNDDPPEAIEFPARGDIEELVAFADVVVMHNSMFDRTVIRHALSVDIPTAIIFDTMACALSHSLPGGLDLLCEVMSVPTDQAKDKAGKDLIQLFCKPRPKSHKLHRATKHTHPAEWDRFLHYAKSDISAMRVLYRKLPRWNYDIGKPEHMIWQLDQKINDRGLNTDCDLARAVIAAVGDEREALAEKTQTMTGGDVQRATQRDALLAHILKEYGIALPDLQKGTLERRIADESLPEDLRELLRVRLSSSAGTAKYKTLLDSVSSDGRLRCTLQYCGAARTGRWAGRLFQPHNMMRPNGQYEDQACVDEAIEAFLLEAADVVLPDVIHASQNVIRGCLTASEGHLIVASDLKNIEGRILAWLAGEEWKLEAFRAFDQGEGPDLYKVTAGRILDKPHDEVTKPERQSYGKVSELSCGYQGALGAFKAFAKVYGLEIEDEDALRIVKQWRKAHPATVSFWYALEDAARKATEQPGVVFHVGRIAFKREGAWLRMRLPSSRVLCYPSPRIEDVKSPCPACHGDGVVFPEGVHPVTFLPSEDENAIKCRKCNGAGEIWRNQLTYMGLDKYTRKWSRQKTYGGNLAADATQGTARDVIACGIVAADCAGYDVLLSVHDEVVAETDDPELQDEDMLGTCMTGGYGGVLDWADGLPLSADGFVSRRYRK